MKALAAKIENTVGNYARLLTALQADAFSEKKVPGKWSKKEILGHLIDSAQNNIQRFVRAQYEVSPKIVYAQDDWVISQHYQSYDKQSLVQLWVSLNKHLCHILVTMDASQYEKQCNTGKSSVELHTLSFLAEDYLEHMMHHLHQIEKRD